MNHRITTPPLPLARPLAASAVALLAVASVYAANFSTLVPAKSSVGFGYKQMNVPLSGQFKKFSAQLSFDPARPEAASASLDIDMASVDTGSDEADEEVVGKEWFNVKGYPSARFVSTSVKPLGGERYQVEGKLSIKGKTLPVTAPVTYKADGANAQFDGAFTIKRLDYNIGEGEWKDTGTVANDIQIKFHIVAAAGK